MEKATTTSTPRVGKLQQLVKKFRWVIVGLLIIAALFLIGKGVKKYNEVQGQYVTFTAVDGTFSLEHPRNWEVQLPGKGAIVATLITDAVPSSSAAKPYINIAKGAVKGNLDHEYLSAKEKYQKLFNHMQIVEEKQTMFGSAPAKMMVMNGSVGGRLVHYAIAFAEYNNEIYTLTASSDPTDGAVLDKQFAKVLSSWKFEKKEVVKKEEAKGPAKAEPQKK